MNSLLDFIVIPKGKITTSIKNVNNKNIILNTELQNHNYVNRIGVVIAEPLINNTNIKKGDEIIVHHNVFRRFYDIRGKEKNSRSYLEENKYLVNQQQIFAVKKERWECLKGFCFVKPLKEDKMFSMDFEKPGIGIVKYTDGSIEKNALVGYKLGFEYDFYIDKEKLYRVPANQITIKYEYQGDEEEYNPSWAKSS
jgi:hypothetical protein